VSAGAGIVLLAKPGDTVTAGQPLLELHADDTSRFDRALQALEGGYDISAAGTPFASAPLVIDRITA
jgi:thymidine phosphorylase